MVTPKTFLQKQHLGAIFNVLGLLQNHPGRQLFLLDCFTARKMAMKFNSRWFNNKGKIESGQNGPLGHEF